MQKFYAFCIRFMEITALLLFGILAAAAFFRTAYVENAYEIVILLGWDNPLLNILFLACFLSLLILLMKLFSNMKHGNKILLVLTCLWVFGASLLWTYFSKSGPASDCGSVYYAAKQFAVNDFSAISYRDSYFSVYPFQLGLAFFYELIFRVLHYDNFHILQGINALCLVLCVISQYHLCGHFFAEKQAQTGTLLLTAFCLPFIMYGSFIYGEIPSFAFLLFGAWMLLLFLDNPQKTDSAGEAVFPSFGKKIFYGGLSLISITCSVLVRKNTLIFLIALGIILILWLIQHKKEFSGKKTALYLLYFFLLFSLSVGVLPAVQNLYARRSGQELNPGIPASTYLAMGLMEAESGPGQYNGYNFETFTETADYDAQTASAIGWADYRERLDYFAAHPAYAFRFFATKFCNQWLNTGWSVFDSLFVPFGERIPIIESCFSGPLYNILRDYMTNYQMTLYLLVTAGVLSLFRSHERKNIFTYLFLLTAFGGALFFLAWEAGGRYVLPYAIFVLPHGGYGMSRLAEVSKRLSIPRHFKKQKGGSL